jgi:hypothetical protein
MRKLLFSSLLVAACITPSLAAQQMSFDYITFDRIRLDPNFALGTSTRWGILVNTGSVPISLTDDWEKGLWYAESSELLGNFFYELLDPFGAGFILQPGEAVGDADPLLLAELLPGETFTTNALIAPFQFGTPFPSEDFHIDVLAQIGDLIATTRTDVELADLGGSDFWVPVSAKRVSAVPSPVSSVVYGDACPGAFGDASLRAYGFNGGSGPPWIAYRSNMPQIGNWAFGFQIVSPTFNASYLLGIDVAPGSLVVGGCEFLLGLTPAITLIPGQIPNFQVTQPVPIPNNPGLVGLTIYAQAALLPPAFLTTNALAVTLGDVAP